MNVALTALEAPARIAVAMLFNGLWEAALLAVLVALVLRIVPNVNATTRYAAWCAALVGSLVLAFATALPHVATRAIVTVTPQSASVDRPNRIPVHVSRITGSTNSVRVVTPRSGAAQPWRATFTLPQEIAMPVFALWSLAALAFLLRLIVNLWKLERLKADAMPLPVDYRERLQQFATADKGDREVRLCTSDGIAVPVAVGLFDSMILLPVHLLQTLDQTEIDQILLHELAHLRRADDWTNALQRFIQAVLFFNPAVMYMAQQLDLEREVACDDWVVNQTQAVRPYATCLTKMAEATAWPHQPLAAPGVFVTRRGLSVRVERLLRAGRNIRTGIALGPSGAMAAVLLVVFFVLQSLAPTFAFTIPTLAVTAMPKAVAVATATPRVMHIPAVHVHIPARTVTIKAVNIDVPARKITLPPTVNISPMPTISPLPPHFSRDLEREIDRSVFSGIQAGMQGLRAGMQGLQAGSQVGQDFSRQDLSGKNFHGKRLTGADFSAANLRNADFSNSVLTGVDFSRADLRGATFADATLTGCDLSHAQLAGTNFQGARLSGCDLNARALAPSQARAVLAGCTSACDLSGADLRGENLRGLRLEAEDMSGADLRGADLRGGSFTAVDFEHARFDGTNVTGASFYNCGFDEGVAATLLARGAHIVEGGSP